MKFKIVANKENEHARTNLYAFEVGRVSPDHLDRLLSDSLDTGLPDCYSSPPRRGMNLDVMSSWEVTRRDGSNGGAYQHSALVHRSPQRRTLGRVQVKGNHYVTQKGIAVNRFFALFQDDAAEACIIQCFGAKLGNLNTIRFATKQYTSDVGGWLHKFSTYELREALDVSKGAQPSSLVGKLQWYMAHMFSQLIARFHDFSPNPTESDPTKPGYTNVSGVIHNDLKPWNIFVNDQGFLRTGDLDSVVAVTRDGGAAFFIDEAGTRHDIPTTLTHFAGTPEYIAPELFTASDDYPFLPTPKQDAFALGVTIAEMLNINLDILRQSSFCVVPDGVEDIPRPPENIRSYLDARFPRLGDQAIPGSKKRSRGETSEAGSEPKRGKVESEKWFESSEFTHRTRVEDHPYCQERDLLAANDLEKWTTLYTSFKEESDNHVSDDNFALLVVIFGLIRTNPEERLTAKEAAEYTRRFLAPGSTNPIFFDEALHNAFKEITKDEDPFLSKMF